MDPRKGVEIDMREAANTTNVVEAEIDLPVKMRDTNEPAERARESTDADVLCWLVYEQDEDVFVVT